MLDLTREEKIVLVFILASFLVGSTVSHYGKRSKNFPAMRPVLRGQGERALKEININTADTNALIKIKGVGVKTAERIIGYRQVNGPFFSKEDIMNIKGIGPNKFKALKEHISVK
ncbi:MAG: helix-hairpin-helix domain-containing protein [Candidatus Omnitrophota bacterium]